MGPNHSIVEVRNTLLKDNTINIKLNDSQKHFKNFKLEYISGKLTITPMDFKLFSYTTPESIPINLVAVQASNDINDIISLISTSTNSGITMDFPTTLSYADKEFNLLIEDNYDIKINTGYKDVATIKYRKKYSSTNWLVIKLSQIYEKIERLNNIAMSLDSKIQIYSDRVNYYGFKLLYDNYTLIIDSKQSMSYTEKLTSRTEPIPIDISTYNSNNDPLTLTFKTLLPRIDSTTSLLNNISKLHIKEGYGINLQNSELFTTDSDETSFAGPMTLFTNIYSYEFPFIITSINNSNETRVYDTTVNYFNANINTSVNNNLSAVSNGDVLTLSCIVLNYTSIKDLYIKIGLY